MKILDKNDLEKVLATASVYKKNSLSSLHDDSEAQHKQSILPASDRLVTRTVDHYQLVKNKALALLGRREYTRKELALKLSEAEFDFGEQTFQKNDLLILVERVLTQLVDEKILSDQRYCEMLIRSRVHKYSGPFKIRMELQQKGVAAALIEVSLKNSNIDWFDLALQAARKKLGANGSNRMVLNQKDKARLQRFLGSRGFLQEHIHYAIETL